MLFLCVNVTKQERWVSKRNTKMMNRENEEQGKKLDILLLLLLFNRLTEEAR